jgi:hypothetical protein
MIDYTYTRSLTTDQMYFRLPESLLQCLTNLIIKTALVVCRLAFLPEDSKGRRVIVLVLPKSSVRPTGRRLLHLTLAR